MALQVEHRVEHQLARGVVGDLAAPVDAKQGRRRLAWIETQEGLAGAAAQGVTGLVLEHQDPIGCVWIGQQPALELLLPGPGPGERHRARRLETDSFEFGIAHKPFLAWGHPPLPEAQG